MLHHTAAALHDLQPAHTSALSAMELPVAPAEPAPDCWSSARVRDALTHVLLLLPPDARARAACVCPQWRDAAADPAVRGVLHFRGAAVPATDVLLGMLCHQAGKALRELHLNSDECEEHGANQRGVSSIDAVITALRAGGCINVSHLVLEDRKKRRMNLRCTLRTAQQLAALLPKLKHAECVVRCANLDEADAARALLPGPLTLYMNYTLVLEAGCKVPPVVSETINDTSAVRAAVKNAVCGVLGADADVRDDQPLLDSGLDSMTAVELVNTLERHFRVELPGTLVFDFPTIDAIAVFLAPPHAQ